MQANRKTRTQALVSMAIIAVFACLFNFFPDKVGTYRISGGSTTFTPMLAPAFEDHLLGLNLWWSLAFVLNIFLLRAGRWTAGLRWAEVAVELLGAFVLARLVISGPFLPVAGGVPLRYLFGFAVLGMLFDAVRKLINLLNGRWPVYRPRSAGE